MVKYIFVFQISVKFKISFFFLNFWPI